MPSEIKAIETSYRGCKFRSRLEARWALLFTTLGIQWEYEPQGFEISDCEDTKWHYLPDFYFPKTKTWVEVKGDVARFDRRMLDWAIDYGGQLPDVSDSVGSTRGLLLLGPIPFVDGDTWPMHPILQHHKGGWVNEAFFSEGGLDVSTEYDHLFDACSDGLNGIWGEITKFWAPIPPSGGGATSLVTHAYRQARSARFEFGATVR